MGQPVESKKSSVKVVVFARVDEDLARYLDVVCSWRGLKKQDAVALALTEWLEKFRGRVPSPTD